MRGAGLRIAAVTNGSAETTRKMFQNAGSEEAIDQFISIDDVQHWKPAAAVYLHAARALDVQPDALAMIAAHDWTSTARAKPA